jgi:hypothetical protein
MNHCTPVATGETLVSARVVDHETDRLPRTEAEKVIGPHPVGFGQAEVNYPNAYDAAGGLGGQKNEKEAGAHG